MEVWFWWFSSVCELCEMCVKSDQETTDKIALFMSRVWYTTYVVWNSFLSCSSVLFETESGGVERIDLTQVVVKFKHESDI